MKKAVLLSVLFIACKLQGQVLYECTSPTADTVTYLLGTHHNLSPDKFRFDPRLDSLIRQSEKLFVEVNTKDTSTAYRLFMVQAVRIVSFPRRKHLWDYLTADEMRTVRGFYQTEFAIADSVFDRFAYTRPFFMNEALRGRNTISVDDAIRNAALEAGKPVIALDRSILLLQSYQWLAKSFPPDSLLRMARDYPVLSSVYENLATAYLLQDTALVNKYALQLFSPELIAELIDKRNRLWEALLLQESSRKNFIAVGSAHLLLGGGLLDFYRKRDYRVRAVAIDLVKR